MSDPSKPVLEVHSTNQVVKTAHERVKDFGFLPIPRRLQHNPDKPINYGLVLHVAFLLTVTFTVANLYYAQPLLIQFSDAFAVSNKKVVKIPTLIQAGYAVGLLLVAPLGDLVRRRPLALFLMALSAFLTIGLAVAKNFVAFETISFLLGVANVTPQVLLPLAADLATPEKRPRAISVIFSGFLFGILIARVIAGVIAQFTSWRVVYYFAIGVQFASLLGCYFVLPDTPAKNQGLNYWQILWSMAKFLVTEPVLIQVCLINLGAMASFSGYWTTLTFLLGDAPYHYSTVVIGLFGLVGMAGVILSPVFGLIIERLVPWYACLFSIAALVCFQAILVGAAGISIVPVIISTIGLDIFRQLLQVSLATIRFSVAPEARSRFNSLALLFVYIGQVMGTSVGTTVFVAHGWRPGAALLLALYGFQFFILVIRGPHCSRYTWFGYEGGFSAFKAPSTAIPSSKPVNGMDQSEKFEGDDKQDVLDA